MKNKIWLVFAIGGGFAALFALILVAATHVQQGTPEQQAKIKAHLEQVQAEASAKAEADRVAQEAKGKADEAAWKQTKAGKICASHPKWSHDDCEGVADERVWVGMSYDMLVYEYGKPDTANPSNYGNGTRYQYCWNDYKPSCFYDVNADGVIDAFN